MRWLSVSMLLLTACGSPVAPTSAPAEAAPAVTAPVEPSPPAPVEPVIEAAPAGPPPAYPIPRIEMGHAHLHGRHEIEAEVIERVIHRHINEVRFCYEQALAPLPTLAGRLEISFSISPEGQTTVDGVDLAFGVHDGAPEVAHVDACLREVAPRWSFPATPRATRASLPFELSWTLPEGAVGPPLPRVAPGMIGLGSLGHIGS